MKYIQLDSVLIQFIVDTMQNCLLNLKTALSNTITAVLTSYLALIFISETPQQLIRSIIDTAKENILLKPLSIRNTLLCIIYVSNK